MAMTMPSTEIVTSPTLNPKKIADRLPATSVDCMPQGAATTSNARPISATRATPDVRTASWLSVSRRRPTV